MEMKIGLFGLSANPPTGLHGHQGIVKRLVESGEFEEVWILPVYRHIMKDLTGSAPFEDRYEMCRLCFEPESTNSTRVKVLKLEEELFHQFPPDVRVGTIDILKHIHDHYKDVEEITLVLGQDTFRDLALGKWKDFDEIPRYCRFLVFDRDETGRDFEQNQDYLNFKQRHSHRISEKKGWVHGRVSSTSLRSTKPWQVEGYHNPDAIHEVVSQYIRRRNLYSER